MKKAVTDFYNVRTINRNGFVFIFTRSGTQASIETEVIPQISFDETDYNDRSTFMW
jgi:hypothetical protein